MLEWLIDLLLDFLGIRTWLQNRAVKAEGVQQQVNADLEAQNAVLKKRESVQHPTSNPFDDGNF
jgi:sensor domain CHASE-containing protein